MKQLLGALLIAGCGLWFGNRQATQLMRRVSALEGLEAALRQVGRELTLRCTALPQLFAAMGGQAPWPAGGLFLNCAAALEESRAERFPQIWTDLVNQLPYLHEEERRCLSGLGQVLGRYPGRDQEGAIEQVCRALEEYARSARQDSMRMGRVWRALGAAGGGFLVILLL